MQRIILLALVFGALALGQPVYYTYNSPGLVVSPFDIFLPESYEIVSENGFLPTSQYYFGTFSNQLIYCETGTGIGCSVALEQLLGQARPTVFSAIFPSEQPNAPYGDSYFEDFFDTSLQQLGTYTGMQGGTLTISYAELLEPVPEPASYALIGAGLLLLWLQWRLRRSGRREITSV